MYPHYSFRGESKNAAFKHCAGQDQGGFGWIVGVGIDDRDTFATVRELQRVLWGATGLVLGTVVVLTMLVARRTTRPIRELKEHTLRLAKGDLSARVDVRSDDELGDLGRAFNSMTSELDESRARLVKAEKDAAWREMARQVAHEIKNPLTPMRMSAQTYLRKKSDESAERLARTVVEQTDTLARIANDFRHFAAPTGPSKQRLAGDELLAAAEQLFAGEAAERNLTLLVEPGAAGTRIEVDRQDLQRVVTNLLRNAFEACGPGGRIELRSQREAERFVLRVIDDGPGVTAQARARLFEPNFTTKSAGTGLGLALCKRIVESWQGTIELESSAPGRTVFRVGIPVVAAECR
jgi:nitrogen fixation/metabolism regulation signal transduction histidine kinase